jgi:hypothetical protein
MHNQQHVLFSDSVQFLNTDKSNTVQFCYSFCYCDKENTQTPLHLSIYQSFINFGIPIANAETKIINCKFKNISYESLHIT